MHKNRRFFKCLTALTLVLAIAFPGLSHAQVALDGATFGYTRTATLRSAIGPRAVPTLKVIRGVGGVAFVREATGADGWTVLGMHYDPTASDGQRLSVRLARNGGTVTTIRPKVWDWEIVPLSRFVLSDYDAAFTYFGELSEGSSSTIQDSNAVSYHAALKDTLMGLRLMQLDLMLFQEPFAGYITDLNGNVILGGGERAAFGRDKNPADKETVRRERETIRERIQAANSFLEEDCQKNPSLTCAMTFQPFDTYIVGDMISPIRFEVSGDELIFTDRGLCWDFSRETEPGEESTPGLEGIRLLRPLSEAFCEKVRGELTGLHPVVYRAAHRAMQYAGLMRHFKTRSPMEFAKFVSSFDGVTAAPSVSTPTEIAVDGAISETDFLKLLELLEDLGEVQE